MCDSFYNNNKQPAKQYLQQIWRLHKQTTEMSENNMLI